MKPECSSGDALPRLPGSAGWLASASLPRRLALGFSGGVDSTALLLALAGAGHEVVAWHVDHGWHDGSWAVSEALRVKLADWGVEFHSRRVQVDTDRNREAEARYARFACFAEWAVEQRIDTLCLAQHLGDQAETVCMRLLQGAGPAGCTGMRQVRSWQGLRIVRPLLHVGRAALEQALVDAGVDWIEDASNLDTSLLRNRVRRELFPAMQAAGADPIELFGRWQAQAAKLSGRLDVLADQVALDARDGDIVADWQAWRESPAAVRAVVLQRMNARLFGEGAVLGRRHILLAEVWRGQGARSGIDLSGCRLFRRRENLHLARAQVSFPGA